MDIFGDLTAEEYFALLDELRDEMVRAIDLRIAQLKAQYSNAYDEIEDWQGFDN
ncbi:MAG: hypothetical protein J6S67_20150 [Methanobrevibacter sp.]|nr:hypothetical protein [Methanobrevibacter sp.]